jgi:YidC/Oxa1 family membrane protein insertase
MEQTRLLVAIALSFLVFLLWSVVFGPKKSEIPAEQAQQTSVSATPLEKPTPAVPKLEAVEKQISGEQTPAKDAQLSKIARVISVDTALYHITVSEEGAAVVSMVLKDYRETIDADSPNKELISKEIKGGTVITAFGGDSGSHLEKAIFTADKSAERISLQGAPADLRFVFVTADGVRIEKSYRFFPDSYLIDLTIKIHNGSDQVIQGPLKVGLRDLAALQDAAYGFQGPSGLINGGLEQVKVKKIAEKNKLEGKIRWVAIEGQYFMSSLISTTPIEGAMLLAHNDKIVENQLVIQTEAIAPGSDQTVAYSIFMGPKSLSVLKAVNNELDRAIDFGWLEVLAKPCLYFMNFIYRYIPNYGIAIIILTIVTRLIFWPLAQKSYKSMNDMRRLQPLMQEIKEKYKDDKARINQETMALYRTYKINPMGGCLPMLIQMPVFFALYRMLYQAIELRHAPFFGWINDLSAPDRLFHFAFKIPFMNEPYGIPVLTIIMGATMLLQQKLSPQAGDPTQAKMMMMMPIVFTFIFINFPSGLVLYWLVSNLVSIAQQYYTQKKLG